MKPTDQDPWKEQILYYLSESDPNDRVTGKELLAEAIGVPLDHQERHHYRRMSRVMQDLGWRRTVYREDGKSVKGYSRMDSEREMNLRWSIR